MNVFINNLCKAIAFIKHILAKFYQFEEIKIFAILLGGYKNILS